MSGWTTERAKVAALTRSRTATDPDLIAARQRLKAARLADHIDKALTTAPPLTDNQLNQLSRLLVGGAPE